MPAELLTHEVRQRRTGTGVLGLALGAFAFFGLAISGSLGTALDEMTKSFPKALAAFLGSDVPGGYVVGEIFNLIAPVALVAYAVLAGASAVAGEEASGTMSILSAQPVTRGRVLAAKAGGLAVSLVAIGLLFWAGMAVASVIFDSQITAGPLAAGTVHLLFLALAFAAIALAVGAATGRPEVALRHRRRDRGGGLPDQRHAAAGRNGPLGRTEPLVLRLGHGRLRGRDLRGRILHLSPA